jgi:hypothetical protein
MLEGFAYTGTEQVVEMLGLTPEDLPGLGGYGIAVYALGQAAEQGHIPKKQVKKLKQDISNGVPPEESSVVTAIIDNDLQITVPQKPWSGKHQQIDRRLPATRGPQGRRVFNEHRGTGRYSSINEQSRQGNVFTSR